MREIKVGFTRFYNRRHNRRGYFWGDRFKSVIVQNGETLINCLAYIDLNPLRAGLSAKQNDIIVYLAQTGKWTITQQAAHLKRASMESKPFGISIWSKTTESKITVQKTASFFEASNQAALRGLICSN